MTDKEYKRLKIGDDVVIIKTGEAGVVTAINRNSDSIQVQAKRAGLGMTKDWYNYTYLATI